MPTTSPAGVLTRAAGDVACPTAITFRLPGSLGSLERARAAQGRLVS
jgi:hypothetical protein